VRRTMKRKAGNSTDWLRNIPRQKNLTYPTFSGPFTKTSRKLRNPSTSSPNTTCDIKGTDFLDNHLQLPQKGENFISIRARQRTTSAVCLSLICNPIDKGNSAITD